MAAASKCDDEGLFSVQSHELSMASMAQSDFDFAYHLQLQEVLSVSGASHSFQNPSPPDDRSLAFSLQTLELSHCQQLASDSRHAQSLQLDHNRSSHDAKFAQSLADLDDGDWESHGDLCEDPFLPEHAHADSCRLYFTAASMEQAGRSSTSRFAIGGIVLDARGSVLMEVRKPLDMGIGKSVADYMALLAGLDTVCSMGLRHVEAHTDSVTLYNQVTRRWRVRSRNLQGLWSQVMEYVLKLERFHIFLDPRSENNCAMRLAREAMDLQSAKENDSTGPETESSEVCTICLEGKHPKGMFSVSECLHRFCTSCIIQHTEVKVQIGQVPVRCPQIACSRTLSLPECQSFLSKKWFDLLNKRLIEVNIPESERVYCPFPNCSALMDRREMDTVREASTSSGVLVTSTRKECVECLRFFCVECRVPWHVSMSCQAYQKLPPALRDAEDANLYQLAEHKNWQRCKKCRRMIELSEGCYHITCRCGYEFCYLCGAQWKNKRQTCNCRLWDEDYLLEEPLLDSEDEDDYDSEEFTDDEFDEETHEDSEDFDEMNGRSNFLFIPNDVAPKNLFYKTKLCKYWQRRNCFAGDNCAFAHGISELR